MSNLVTAIQSSKSPKQTLVWKQIITQDYKQYHSRSWGRQCMSQWNNYHHITLVCYCSGRLIFRLYFLLNMFSSSPLTGHVGVSLCVVRRCVPHVHSWSHPVKVWAKGSKWQDAVDPCSCTASQLQHTTAYSNQQFTLAQVLWRERATVILLACCRAHLASSVEVLFVLS